MMGENEESVHNIKGVNVYDAQSLKDDVIKGINQQICDKEKAELTKKVDVVVKQIRGLTSQLKQNESTIKYFSTKNDFQLSTSKIELLQSKNTTIVAQIQSLETKLKKVESQLQNVAAGYQLDSNLPGTSRQPTYDKKRLSGARSLKERKQLIKKGLATPFSLNEAPVQPKVNKPLRAPARLDDGFASFLTNGLVSKSKTPTKLPDKSKSISNGNKNPSLQQQNKNANEVSTSEAVERTIVPIPKVANRDFKLSPKDEDYRIHTSDEFEDSDEYEIESTPIPKKSPKSVNTKKHAEPSNKEPRICDDANPKTYKKRVLRYKQLLLNAEHDGVQQANDKQFEGGLNVPGRIWSKLYKYQQTCVKWLWELHCQQAGGILGDEMGLGKTVQIIAFLDAMRNSKVRDRDNSLSYDGLGPVLIVSPTTVMHQWVREFHKWAPLLRVAVLHGSGSYKGAKADLIHNITLSRGVLITSYERMRLSLDILIAKKWHYVILDEGHKIRNPEAAITHAVKMFQTPHRLILSGSPIQNQLQELWSLFDFIFPGKLGTLPCFMEQFSVPIVQGGYANATDVQVQTAYKCACILRSTISPYLLRRMKQDVQEHIKLPEKTDQVLFCSLTDHQVEVYKRYLDSETVYSILCRNMKIFVGLIQLRKICNHPDLYTGGHKILVGEEDPDRRDERRYGFWKRSGKMIVLDSLLRIWKKQDKKVLLFTQSKLMLNVLEDFLKLREYTYMSMHGGTSVSSRQPLVNRFNKDPSVFVFLLTTRVGGLGVNLIGANRVVIFDPDWNPSTDAQAQERSWRIGQKKEVTIYRLISTGTIEEKIYHRQIFKQFMSNRVLKDPRQRRFFKTNDIHELFTLKHREEDGSSTETASIFAGTGSEIKLGKLKERRREARRLEQEASTKNAKVSKLQTSPRIPTKSPLQEPQIKQQQHCELNENKSTQNGSSLSPPDGNAVVPATPLDIASDVPSSSVELSSNSGQTDDITATPTSSPTGPDSEVIDYDDGDASTKSQKIRESFLKVMKRFQESKLKMKIEEKSKKKSRRKGDKKKRTFDVDGEVVDFVTKKARYKDGVEGASKNSEDYVLARLFKKGVQSAMKHNTIMNSSTPDYALVESEANRVAREAIRNLKLSRKHYRYPGSGGPVKRPRFGKPKAAPIKAIKRDETSSSDDDTGPSLFGKSTSTPTSSLSILKQIKMRSHSKEEEEEDSGSEREEQTAPFQLGDGSGDEATEDDKLLRRIVTFLNSEKSGEVTTDELMLKFKGHVEVKQAPHFRAMLHRICTRRKDQASGKTTWLLKDEFR